MTEVPRRRPHDRDSFRASTQNTATPERISSSTTITTITSTGTARSSKTGTIGVSFASPEYRINPRYPMTTGNGPLDRTTSRTDAYNQLF